MMKQGIVVVGGYGQVGQVVCHELAKFFPGNVYAAGRSYEKAKRFSDDQGGRVLPLQMDINEGIPEDFFQDVSLVVMCLDLRDTGFVQACIDHQVDYVDITADYSVIAGIEKLSPAGSTVVLSVGLAPGLTNMLAKQGKQRLDTARLADIYVLLGLGEAHGRAAIEWTIDNLAADFSVLEYGRKRQVASFTEGKKTRFPAPFGQRTAYRFNFSDQHVIPRTLDIPSVSTRLCFDSPLVTRTAAGLKRAGGLGWLERPSIRNKAVDLMESWRWGSENFAAKVDVWGEKDGRQTIYQGSVCGVREGYVTGRVAAYVAGKLARERQPFGVFHSEKLFQPAELFMELEDVITLEERIIDIESHEEKGGMAR